MPNPVLTIDPAGTIPIVRVHVGHTQLGEYNITRWNRQGRSPQKVGRGNTLDAVRDEFRLVPTRDELARLDGTMLTWVIWVKALNRAPGARWSYSLGFTQDGSEILRLADEGPMNAFFKPFKGIIDVRFA